jgi:hypothetical protein
MVPKQVMTESAIFGGTTLNMFPAKGGISAHYSPHTLLTGQAINFKKHLAIPFGLCCTDALVQTTYMILYQGIPLGLLVKNKQ